MKKIRIGFDLDGVISENAIFKSKKIKELYNIDLEPWQLTSNIIDTFVPNKSIRRAIGSLSALTIQPNFVDKETISVLKTLKSLDIELYIISRRGKSNQGIEIAKNTIEKLKISDYFKEIIFCETEEEKIEKIKEKNIDLFIDDRIEILNGISSNVHFPLLFDEYDLIKKGLLDFEKKYVVINSFKLIMNYVNFLLMIRSAISELLTKSIIHNPNKYEIISYLNNIVVKVDGLYLKIYKGDSTIRDNELILYKNIENNNMFKEMVFQGIIKLDIEYYFALFKPIHGDTLDNVEYNEKNAQNIAESIYSFIKLTSKIKCEKFGDINGKFEGEYNNFKEYIFNFQHKTATTLYMEPMTRKYSALPYDLLVQYEEYFNINKAYIIPVDLNFKNIIITDQFEIKIIDPGALIAGPLEMAYGEFCAHAYGTIIYDNFEKLICQSDKKLIRIYAILLLLNILAFIIRNNIMSPYLAKPFGNNKTFFELIDEHLKFISQ
ncbi:hypothetical protein D0T84_16070 [Dysgonomonas sp. 521]|uniref:hypothetical protein n=1 Tax=Dysgonomonas sp. 521 TaxID=2302932 RepID=UPI0013D06220|nr:hypothetical protein [Dysgonomonas sp. 521]NDV96418.1 hypothetical protein [Dysgonomonas sp. 521]